jgi:hypothetical protein
MARDPSNFTNTTQLSSSASDVVGVVPTSTKSVIRKASFYNSGSSNRAVTIYVIASGGTAGTTNILVKKSIAPGKTWNCIELQGEVLEVGMKVQAIQDAGTDVNVNCSGVNIT